MKNDLSTLFLLCPQYWEQVPMCAAPCCWHHHCLHYISACGHTSAWGCVCAPMRLNSHRRHCALFAAHGKCNIIFYSNYHWLQDKETAIPLHLQTLKTCTSVAAWLLFAWTVVTWLYVSQEGDCSHLSEFSNLCLQSGHRGSIPIDNSGLSRVWCDLMLKLSLLSTF